MEDPMLTTNNLVYVLVNMLDETKDFNFRQVFIWILPGYLYHESRRLCFASGPLGALEYKEYENYVPAKKDELMKSIFVGEAHKCGDLLGLVRSIPLENGNIGFDDTQWALNALKKMAEEGYFTNERVSQVEMTVASAILEM